MLDSSCGRAISALCGWEKPVVRGMPQLSNAAATAVNVRGKHQLLMLQKVILVWILKSMILSFCEAPKERRTRSGS
jgi:hypothetical protein